MSSIQVQTIGLKRNSPGTQLIFTKENYLANKILSDSSAMKCILHLMEFSEKVQGHTYNFSQIKHESYLVSGPQGEYILYKVKEWKCADELAPNLVRELGAVIESRLEKVHA